MVSISFESQFTFPPSLTLLANNNSFRWGRGEGFDKLIGWKLLTQNYRPVSFKTQCKDESELKEKPDTYNTFDSAGRNYMNAVILSAFI